MNKATEKQEKRARRHTRIRSRVSGTASKPRLAVFRSNRFVYAQLINDETGTTLAAADSREATGANLTERGTSVGKTIAEAGKSGEQVSDLFEREFAGIVGNQTSHVENPVHALASAVQGGFVGQITNNGAHCQVFFNGFLAPDEQTHFVPLVQ